MPSPDKLCMFFLFFFFVRIVRIRFLPSIVLVSFSIRIESISWLEIVSRFNEWKITRVLQNFKGFFSFLFHFKYIRDFIIVKVSTN